MLPRVRLGPDTRALVTGASRGIGRAIAERAQAAGVSRVVFDRGGYLYHGRVKALTDAAREAGLNKDEAATQPVGESNQE